MVTFVASHPSFTLSIAMKTIVAILLSLLLSWSTPTSAFSSSHPPSRRVRGVSSCPSNNTPRPSTRRHYPKRKRRPPRNPQRQRRKPFERVTLLRPFKKRRVSRKSIPKRHSMPYSIPLPVYVTCIVCV